MKRLISAILVLFLFGCHSSHTISGMWNYKKGEELISISLGRGSVGKSTEVINSAMLYHSVYDSNGKQTGKKTYLGEWRFEDDILTVYDTVDGVEKIQFKGNVSNITERSSITIEVLEVHDQLQPMGLVGKTITLRPPQTITRKYRSKRSHLQWWH